MKYISVLWLRMVVIGLLFTSYAYAIAIDEEAKKVAMDYLVSKRIITICQDSFYFFIPEPNNPNDFALGQGKEFYITVSSTQLDYADKLNGIEWKGVANLHR